jgi:transcriptional regulator with XRE-family HTH domain
MASDAWALCLEARRFAGLSQRALATLAGVTPATIARIEKGRMEPTLDLIGRILRAAGLELGLKQRDPDEWKTQVAARALSDEQRLRQNDGLSRLGLASMNKGDG